MRAPFPIFASLLPYSILTIFIDSTAMIFTIINIDGDIQRIVPFNGDAQTIAYALSSNVRYIPVHKSTWSIDKIYGEREHPSVDLT